MLLSPFAGGSLLLPGQAQESEQVERVRLGWLVGLAGGLLCSVTVLASPLDTYEFSAGARSVAGAQIAAPAGPVAAHYNPAGVVSQGRPELLAGVSHHQPSLQVNGQAHSLDGLTLWELGGTVPLPFLPELGEVLALGASIALPQDGIYQLRQDDDTAVNFPLLDSRNRRLVLTWAVAWRIVSWLQIGLGATVLPDVPGRVRANLTEEQGVNTTAIDIEWSWAAVAGLQVRLPWDLQVGLAFRDRQSLEIELPVEVSVMEGFPVNARIEGPAFSTPRRLGLGLAWRPTPRWHLSADLCWFQFSANQPESPQVVILDAAGHELHRFAVAATALQDVLSPRLGAEWWLRDWLAVRAGYAFHPTPVAAQQGPTNLLDGDRHLLSLGLGLRAAQPFRHGPAELELDLGYQLQWLRPVAWEKEAILVGNPGYPTLTADGFVSSVGLGVRMVP